tara:strand:- start:150 stop:308 length:159 start_codon:yes stop_codon:yes gene_type:complete
MEYYDIGTIIAVFLTIFYGKTIDWKSPKTYKVAGLTLLVIGLGVGVLYLLDI